MLVDLKLALFERQANLAGRLFDAGIEDSRTLRIRDV